MHLEQKFELAEELDGWRPPLSCKARRTTRYQLATAALKVLNEDRKKTGPRKDEPASVKNPASPDKSSKTKIRAKGKKQGEKKSERKKAGWRLTKALSPS